MAGSSSVIVTGVPGVVKALAEMDPAANKRLLKALNDAAGELVNTARGFVDPDGLSGWGKWRGGYSASTIASGIKVKKALRSGTGRGGSKNLVGVINSSAAGAIWEVAGRLSDGKTPSGVAMINAINAKGGPASRTIWAAADTTDMADIQGKVLDALSGACAEVQALMNR